MGLTGTPFADDGTLPRVLGVIRDRTSPAVAAGDAVRARLDRAAAAEKARAYAPVALRAEPDHEPVEEPADPPHRAALIERVAAAIEPPELTAPARLDRIAALVRDLTYGEMIELGDAVWSARKADEPMTQDNLAAVLHRWSTTRRQP